MMALALLWRETYPIGYADIPDTNAGQIVYQRRSLLSDRPLLTRVASSVDPMEAVRVQELRVPVIRHSDHHGVEQKVMMYDSLHDMLDIGECRPTPEMLRLLNIVAHRLLDDGGPLSQAWERLSSNRRRQDQRSVVIGEVEGTISRSDPWNFSDTWGDIRASDAAPAGREAVDGNVLGALRRLMDGGILTREQSDEFVRRLLQSNALMGDLSAGSGVVLRTEDIRTMGRQMAQMMFPSPLSPHMPRIPGMAEEKKPATGMPLRPNRRVLDLD